MYHRSALIYLRDNVMVSYVHVAQECSYLSAPRLWQPMFDPKNGMKQFHSNAKFKFTFCLQVYFYLGHLSIAYASAFILSVLFESPFLGLEKIILKLLGA